jgi:hypothetical protein
MASKENTPRNTPQEYVRYMVRNPIYFREITGKSLSEASLILLMQEIFPLHQFERVRGVKYAFSLDRK